MLELSRFQSDRLLLYPEPISIQDVAEQTIEKIKRQSPSHQFTMEFSENLPDIRADQLRLERILYNLLENAAKYSPENGEVQVTAYLDGDYVVVGVSDQGEGISIDDHELLFDSFHRLKQHQRAGVTGTGLGLSVCRVLAEAHGGRIWVESEPGRGSKFFFSLPWR